MRKLAVLGVSLLACTNGDPATGEELQAESAPVEVASVRVASVPADWVRVEASCGYAFWAPPDLLTRTVGSIDSCADGWARGSCLYRGDYGAFSSTLQEYAGFAEYAATRESIDGHAALVVTAVSDEYLVAAVHFPRIDAEVEGIRLTVDAHCQERAAQQDAVSIFKTITFE